eukprot:377619-Pyramimonas_sp.AAC.1
MGESSHAEEARTFNLTWTKHQATVQEPSRLGRAEWELYGKTFSLSCYTRMEAGAHDKSVAEPVVAAVPGQSGRAAQFTHESAAQRN